MISTVARTEGGRMKFGAKLRELRHAAGLSQPGLASASDLSVQIVRDYEASRRIPGWPALVRMARVLGVTVDAFSQCDEVATEPAEPRPAGKRK